MNFGLNGVGGGLSLMRLLGTLSRTIGMVRQITPIYKDMKPLFSKVPLFLEKLNNIRNVNYNIKNYSLNNIVNDDSNSFTTSDKSASNPTFFQ